MEHSNLNWCSLTMMLRRHCAICSIPHLNPLTPDSRERLKQVCVLMNFSRHVPATLPRKQLSQECLGLINCLPLLWPLEATPLEMTNQLQQQLKSIQWTRSGWSPAIVEPGWFLTIPVNIPGPATMMGLTIACSVEYILGESHECPLFECHVHHPPKTINVTDLKVILGPNNKTIKWESYP